MEAKGREGNLLSPVGQPLESPPNRKEAPMPTNDEAAHAAIEINLNILLSPLKEQLMRLRLLHSHRW